MPTTDPTFYRSPGHAVAAAPEQLAYVAAFDPTGQQNDALAVIDCDPESTTSAAWSAGPSYRRPVTNCTISVGTPARARSAMRGMAITGARAAVSARSGSSLVDDLRPRHQARPAPSVGDPHDRGR